MESITQSDNECKHVQFCNECQNGDLFPCHYNCFEIVQKCKECRMYEARLNSLTVMRDDEHRDYDYYMELYILEQARLNKQRNCYFVTITCKYELDAQKFIDRVHKVAHSSSIIRCIYSFEWRHNDNINAKTGYSNEGIHAHMWIDKYKKRQLNQHLKRLNKLKDYMVNIKMFNQKYKKDKFKYITGDTFDIEKNKKKVKDINKRFAYGLKQIYYKNETQEYCDLCETVNERQDINSFTDFKPYESILNKVNTGIVVEF